MNDYWLLQAVANNADWCDAIAASHGIYTTRDESVWLSDDPMPPLYPNVITLSPGALINEIIEEKIDSLKQQLPIGWGIKDSFNDLELAEKGFAVAFQANWYCRPPNEPSDKIQHSGIHVRAVQAEVELNRWITAWGESSGVFNASLLENSAIELVYAERDGELVSGLASNLSCDSVGISNSFGRTKDLLHCIVYVAEAHPTKGIVGYGSKAEVDELSSFGFKEIGDLKVWLSQ